MSRILTLSARASLIFFGCALFSGCAPKPPVPEWVTTTETPASQVAKTDSSARASIASVSTPQSEVLSSVMHTPTQFQLHLPDSKYAWERAELFFKDHTSKSQFSAKQQTVSLNNKGGKDDTEYSVERKGNPDGSQFSVSCTGKAGVSKDLVEKRCHNLARFIKDGVLEEMLLSAK